MANFSKNFVLNVLPIWLISYGKTEVGNVFDNFGYLWTCKHLNISIDTFVMDHSTYSETWNLA